MYSNSSSAPVTYIINCAAATSYGMQKVQLQAEPRSVIGRQVKSLRRQGLVPAVVYGHGFDPLSIQISMKELERVYAEAGESTIVYLNVNGADHPTIIHDITRDALSDKFLHADFYKVRLDEKIHANIQFNFVGESPAVKSLGGILIKNMSEIEVIGFPQDLPHQIDVDLASLAEIRGHIKVKDLKISDKLEVKTDPEAVVVLVQEPISEDDLKAQLEAPVAGGVEDVELIKKEKPEGEPGEEDAEVSTDKEVK